MTAWRVEDGPNGLRLGEVTQLGFDSDDLTWADLLLLKLSQVQVFVLYFPSRFDQDADTQVEDSLRIFGANVSFKTSVSVWDTTDPELDRALQLFHVSNPPALVIARGLRPANGRSAEIDPSDIYSIVFRDARILGDRHQLAAAVNAAHEVIGRGNPREIAGYVRAQSLERLLATIGRVSDAALDLIVRVKPSVELPGGPTLKLG